MGFEIKVDAGVGCSQIVVFRGFTDVLELRIAPFVVFGEKFSIRLLTRARFFFPAAEEVMVARYKLVV